MMSRAQSSIAVVCCLATIACYSPRSAADVEGDWQLTAGSRRLFSDGLGGKSPVISFDRDGTFTAKDLPAEIPGGAIDGSTVSAHGNWQLVPFNGEIAVRLRFVSANRQPLDYGAELFPRGWSNDPVLSFFRGDPDSAIMIEFERSGTQ
jgi:hypothetical protein